MAHALYIRLSHPVSLRNFSILLYALRLFSEDLSLVSDGYITILLKFLYSEICLLRRTGKVWWSKLNVRNIMTVNETMLANWSTNY